MKVRIVRGIILLVMTLVACQYAVFTFDPPFNASSIVSGLEDRPFVYRALVPALAHGLTWLGLSAETALLVLVVVSALGLFYGIIYLFRSIR